MSTQPRKVAPSPRRTLLQGHLGRVGEDRCALVRSLVVANRALMSRAHLEEQAANWLAEVGTLPPRNGVELSLLDVSLIKDITPNPKTPEAAGQRRRARAGGGVRP